MIGPSGNASELSYLRPSVSASISVVVISLFVTLYCQIQGYRTYFALQKFPPREKRESERCVCSLCSLVIRQPTFSQPLLSAPGCVGAQIKCFSGTPDALCLYLAGCWTMNESATNLDKTQTRNTQMRKDRKSVV